MSENHTQYTVVMTIASSKDEARRIASGLVDAKLAACVQVLPIESYFAWDGEVQHEDELLVLIKSKRVDFDAINTKLSELHSYDVPEVISVPIQGGSATYLDWISDVTRR